MKKSHSQSRRALCAVACGVALAFSSLCMPLHCQTPPGGETETPADKSPEQTGKIVPGDSAVEIEVKGLKRHYTVHVPTGYDGKTALPVVIMFHGGGGTAAGAMKETGWAEKADKEKFLAVFPEGSRPDPTTPANFRQNPQTWNDGSDRAIVGAAGREADDVAFVNALIDDLAARFNVDKDRIYATGFSNGASMTFRVGREIAYRIAAIAPAAGSDWLEKPEAGRAVSLLYITGMEDPLNPIDGGEIKLGSRSAGKKPPVREFIMRWVKMLKLPEEPRSVCDKDGVKGVAYSRSDDDDGGGAEVVFYTVEGMGHTWAGGKSLLPESIVGKTSDKVKATDLIWGFFKKHPRK
ncbi:MAG: PHB depolymerase family esterase [Planctomycetota bacterium]|nr:PHB depolymerase family esterase [Planctomycetota bacterium]